MPPLPAEFAQFIATHGAFEGFTSDDPGYIALWPLEEIQANNAGIGIEEYAPGFVAFAGNGGGEVLAFDGSGVVYTLPMIGLAANAAVKVADSFHELAARFELQA
jgi:hypothetical protein